MVTNSFLRVEAQNLTDGGTLWTLRPARLTLGRFGEGGGAPLSLALPDAWSGLTVTAIFIPDRGPVLCQLPENDARLTVPDAVLRTGGGGLRLEAVDGAGLRWRTGTVRYEVSSAPAARLCPPDPPQCAVHPSPWEQFVDRVREHRAAAEQAAQTGARQAAAEVESLLAAYTESAEVSAAAAESARCAAAEAAQSAAAQTAAFAEDVGDIQAALFDLHTELQNIHDVELVPLAEGQYDPVSRVPTLEDPAEYTFYLVPADRSLSNSDNDLFAEWIYAAGAWELFGSARMDLSAYLKRAEFAADYDPAGHGAGQIAFLADVVPKTRTVNGKALSSDITLDAADVGAIALQDEIKYIRCGRCGEVVFPTMSNNSPRHISQRVAFAVPMPDDVKWIHVVVSRDNETSETDYVRLTVGATSPDKEGFTVHYCYAATHGITPNAAYIAIGG